MVSLAVAATGAATACNKMPRTSAKPPTTRVEPVKESFHGTEVTDNYRWLEGDVAEPANPQKVTPDVISWTDAQNAYTREVLDNLPGRKAVEDRLRPLMEIGAVSTPAMRGNRYFLARREGTQNQAVYYWREGARGKDRVLVDPAALDSSGLTTIEWMSPSHDGKLAAYGTYKAGDENTTLHVIDVDSAVVPSPRVRTKVRRETDITPPCCGC